MRDARASRPRRAEAGSSCRPCCTENRRDRRPCDGADRGAGGDVAVEALRLSGGEEVGEETPEDADDEEVHHALPDVERAADVRGRDLGGEEPPEGEKRGREESVHADQERASRKRRARPAEDRRREKHHDEGGGEEDGQGAVPSRTPSESRTGRNIEKLARMQKAQIALMTTIARRGGAGASCGCLATSSMRRLRAYRLGASAVHAHGTQCGRGASLRRGRSLHALTVVRDLRAVR
jgi:hypothetical protein